jgi:ABC-type transport system substrate-binding protein
MNQKIVTTIAILMFASMLLSTLPSALAVSRDEYPRLDELIGVISYPEATAMGLARAGTIDAMRGMISADNVEELQGLGWSISANPGFHMCPLMLNCRNVAPETAGQPSSGGTAPPYSRSPGFPLVPMNISEFRYALHLLIGSQKTDWIASIYRFINVRLDTNIPPASAFWYNPDLPPVPYDPVQALNLLTTAGFSNSTGKWMMPNGQELRKIISMAPIEAPTSVTLMGYAVTAWNKFFGLGSDGKPYFELVTQIFNDEVEFTFINRDFDVAWVCWGLGRNPDYLYDFFHPDGDIPDGSNAPGLDYPPLNDALYAIKYWKWPNGTTITNLDGMKKVVFYAQNLLYVLNPYIPMYSRKYHNAYAPGVENWVDSLGYGSFPDSGPGHTFNWINWGTGGTPNPTKPSLRFQIGGALGKLNPITSTTAYDACVNNRLLEGLLDINPYTHADTLGSVAQDWTPKGGFTPYSNTTENVPDGMKVTFKLRPGVTWQDGVAVDANTVKFNLDFIDRIEAPRFYDIFTNYVKSVVTAPDTVDIYINGTGIWLLYNFAGSTLVVPPQIYGPNGPCDANKDGTVTYAEVNAFKPYETPHPTVAGLTCLIGTGSWIFKEWNKLTQTVRFVKNTNYWAKNFVREDLNFDGVINIQDISLAALAFGADKNHPRWRYGESDVTGDGKVNIQDITKVALKWQKVTLPKS